MKAMATIVSKEKKLKKVAIPKVIPGDKKDREKGYPKATAKPAVRPETHSLASDEETIDPDLEIVEGAVSSMEAKRKA